MRKKRNAKKKKSEKKMRKKRNAKKKKSEKKMRKKRNAKKKDIFFSFFFFFFFFFSPRTSERLHTVPEIDVFFLLLFFSFERPLYTISGLTFVSEPSPPCLWKPDNVFIHSVVQGLKSAHRASQRLVPVPFDRYLLTRVRIILIFF
jgi:hypothetical protein